MRHHHLIRLTESGPKDEGRIWEVTVIESGISANGNLYTPGVLAEACKLFEGAPVAIYEFIGKDSAVPGYDHIPDWVRSRFPGGVAKNVAGWLTNVRMGEAISKSGEAVPAMIADLNVTDEWLRNTLLESFKGGKHDLLELSIEARGPSKSIYHEGRMVHEVLRIDEAVELTVVSQGAAGGKVRRLVASVGGADEIRLAFGGGKFHVISGQQLIGSYESITEGQVAWAAALREAESIGHTNGGEDKSPTESLPTTTERQDQSHMPKLLLESPRSRQGLVKALRALGYDGSLEESTTAEVLSLLEQQLQTRKESPVLTAGSLEEAVQTDLMQAIDLIKSGDIDTALNLLEQCLQAMASDDGGAPPPQEAATMTWKKNKTAAAGAPGCESVEEVAEAAPLSPTKATPVSAVQQAMLAESRANAKRAEEASQRALLAESRGYLASHMADCNLPEKAKQIITKRFAGKVFPENELKEAIAEQRSVLEELMPGNPNPVTGHGGEVIVGASRIDYMKAMADQLCGYDYTRDAKLSESQKDVYRALPIMPSLKSFYIQAMDDPDCSFKQCGPGSVFKEATSSSLPQLLGDSMTRVLIQRYEDQEKIWDQLANVVPVSSFRVQRRILMGGLGILPSVVESDKVDTYERLGFGADEERTYSVDTKGGLIVITRKAIINDDLGGIQRMPEEAAEAAANTLQLVVMRALLANTGGGGINTDTSYDGYTIYNANHRNLGVSALEYATFIASWNRLRRQRRFANVGALGGAIANGTDTNITVNADLKEACKVGDVLGIEAELLLVTAATGTTPTTDLTVQRGYGGSTGVAHSNGARVEQLGSPIKTNPITCVYPYGLEAIAQAVFNSEFVPGGNLNDRSLAYAEARAGRVKPLSVHEMYLGDDYNNWYNAAGKPLEVGFLGGRQQPELFLQDNPLVNGVFSGDRISWKVRHEYGVLLTDHRLVDGNIVP